MKTRNTFEAIPFVNHFGKTIEVGDKVITVIKSTSYVGVREAVFCGVYKNAKGTIVGTRVSRQRQITHMWVDEKGNELKNWRGGAKYVKREVPLTETYTTALQRNRIYKMA